MSTDVIKPAGSIMTEEEINRDLGFGSVVAERAQKRLLNKDGSFNVRRHGLGFWDTLSGYHFLLNLSWPKFFGIYLLGYCLVNVTFAAAYYACGPEALAGGADLGRVWQTFFFSIETFATIGYGNIQPVGLVANLLVSLEAVVSLLSFALATGLVFARFSRPTAKIIYSKHAIIAPYQGITSFQFRITNARTSQLIEVGARVVMSRFTGTPQGRKRQFYTLRLERKSVAFFPLAWTVVHPIETDSPLYGWTDQMLREADTEFLVLLTGIEETFSQQVHSRSSYKSDEIIWNARFANLYENNAKGDDLAIDMEKFHEVMRG
jgi:inward rectifier potassium channel